MYAKKTLAATRKKHLPRDANKSATPTYFYFMVTKKKGGNVNSIDFYGVQLFITCKLNNI